MDDRWRELESHLRHLEPVRSAVTLPLPASPTAWSPALAGANEVVALVRRLAAGADRHDLVSQLDGIAARLRVHPVPVLVVGGAGQGKSSLTNALLGAPVCPIGPDRSTAVATAAVHASAYRAEVVFDSPPARDPDEHRRALGYPEAVALISAPDNPANRWRLRLVEVGVPSPTLRRGLVLVDTPPITDVWSADGTRLLRAASGAAAVVLVTSAATELTCGELDLLRAVAAQCRRITVVLNGTNVFAQWRSIIERDHLLLEQRGIDAHVVAVAAQPYWGASGGLAPGPDPGVRALAAHLEQSVLLDTEHQRISRALVDAFWAADRLRLRLHAERTLLRVDDDDGYVARSDRLRQAAKDAEALCVPSAEWHRLLTHGLRDLRRDMAADLATELARLRAEAEAIDGSATTDHDGLVQLHAGLADAVVHIHRVRKLSLRALAKRVGDELLAEWTRIVTDLDLAADVGPSLDLRLDRPPLAGPTSMADIGLAPQPAGPAPITTAAGWLSVIEEFLRLDTSDTLERAGADLAHRCQQRAIELHRSIIEVSTTSTMIRDLDPATVLRRHEALENDLEQLESLDLHRAADITASRRPPIGR